MGFIGLAVDGGVLWYKKSLQDGRADAAALAGGHELTQAAAAKEKALQYLFLNDTIDVSNGGDTTIEISFAQNTVPNDVIVVDLYKDEPLYFLPILGFQTATIHSHAAVFATSWAADQKWDLFRGGCGRTGYQVDSWTDTYNQAANGDFQLGYLWGFRWDLNGDTENHRSTPTVAMHAGIASGMPVAYIGTNGPSKNGVGGGVFAFNAMDGSQLWFKDLGTMVRSSPFFLNDPAVTNIANGGYPMIIVAAHNGHEYALDARDGSIVWDTPGISSDVLESGSQKYRSSPAYSCGAITIGGVTYNGVIFNATYGGNIYAYNAETGAILWRSTPLPSSTATWITTGNDALALSRDKITGPIYGTANYVKDTEFTNAGYAQGVIYVPAFGNNSKGSGGGTDVWIWDAGKRNSPLDYAFGAGERSVQREIGTNMLKNLVFEFKKNANTGAGNYDIQIWFEGCGTDVILLSAGDGSACGGAVTSTLTLSINKKRVTLPLAQGADPNTHRISRIWIAWPDGTNQDLKMIYMNDAATGNYPDSPYLYALDAATGERIWFDVLDDYVSPATPSDRNSNAVGKIDTNRDGVPDEWRVFANPTDNFLYAYNAITGTRIWRKETGADNHRSDPAIYRNYVFGGNNSGVYALDAVDGFSIWDNIDSDGVLGTADKVNPHFNDTNPGGGPAFNAFGTRLSPGGVKSAPAVVDGIIMVGANQTSLGASGGSMWGLWWENGRDLGHYDTNLYDGAGP
ncbi:MAG: PQQ-binding-like beta-propeller repeat protein, partial [Anaerolineae bacterium]